MCTQIEVTKWILDVNFSFDKCQIWNNCVIHEISSI